MNAVDAMETMTQQELDVASAALIEVIDLAGSQSALAARYGRDRSAVTLWKVRGCVPHQLAAVIARDYGVPAWRLRPDLYSPDRAA